MKKICIFILEFIILISINSKNVFASITISPKDISLGINYSENLKVFGTTSNDISWVSSNENVVLVNNGIIIAKSIGQAYIKATDGNSIAICKVNVIDNYVPIKSISLPKTSETLLLNTTSKINTTILPINASNKNPTYISDSPNIVSVNSSGYITGKKIGTANISISIESKTVIYKVTVVDKIKLEGIKTQATVQLKQNATTKLTITYTPTNATNKTVTWKSSNTNIVTVDQNGNLKAISPGTATITITSSDGGYIATSKVTVISNSTGSTNQSTENTNSKIDLKSISLNKSNLSLNIGDEETLILTYNPNNATDKTVTWKSSNTEVVTVDNNGRLKALASGTSMITVTSNDGAKTAKCAVTVISNDNDTNSSDKDKKIESIKLNTNKLILKKNKEEKLTIEFNPSDALNKDVIWESSNEDVATVSNGTITAIAPGKTKIKVTSVEGNHEDTCEVTVYSDLPIEAIEFEDTHQILYVGSTIELKTISTPEDTMFDNPIWVSSNEDVATVEKGVVTGLKTGTTTISISDENEQIIATATINVIEKPADKLAITIEGYELNFDPNIKNYTLTIGNETSLNIKTNYDESKITIGGNRDLKNGSIITITATGTGNTKNTYVINIKKKEFNIIYFIAIISILLLLNIIRILVNNKKRKK